MGTKVKGPKKTIRRQLVRLDADEAPLLLNIADRLASTSKPLRRKDRALFAAMLRHIAKPRNEPQTDAADREFRAALIYRMLCELHDLAGNSARRKVLRGRVANEFGYGDQAISNAATEWKEQVDSWLSRMAANIHYDDLSRAEMLQRELLSLLGDKNPLLEP